MPFPIEYWFSHHHDLITPRANRLAKVVALENVSRPKPMREWVVRYVLRSQPQSVAHFVLLSPLRSQTRENMNPKISGSYLPWLGLTLLFGAGVAVPLAAGSTPVFANGQVAQSVATATHTREAGREIYAANCAACHGVNGAGGTGSSLQLIGARRSFDQTVTFIESPVGAMPKLYPGKLSAEQVREVATYIRAAFRSPGSPNAQPNGGPRRMGPGMMHGSGQRGNGPGMMYGNPRQ
jgi:cytochrome c551